MHGDILGYPCLRPVCRYSADVVRREMLKAFAGFSLPPEVTERAGLPISVDPSRIHSSVHCMLFHALSTFFYLFHALSTSRSYCLSISSSLSAMLYFLIPTLCALCCHREYCVCCCHPSILSPLPQPSTPDTLLQFEICTTCASHVYPDHAVAVAVAT